MIGQNLTFNEIGSEVRVSLAVTLRTPIQNHLYAFSYFRPAKEMPVVSLYILIYHKVDTNGMLYRKTTNYNSRSISLKRE